MQVRDISWDEVVRAGTVIFGPRFSADVHVGGWRGELKTAYRRRVLETHPDRAVVLGRTEAELLREFRAVSEAYDLLVELRAGPLPVPRSRPRRQAPTSTARSAPAPAARRAPPAAPRSTPRTERTQRGARAERTGWTAPPVEPGPTRRAAPAAAPGAQERPGWTDLGLPGRRLRMAEFLYYSGRVGWQDFVAAVAWQRQQRPAVGRIALDFGFLERFEVSEILERRRTEGAHREPFGEFAVRRGYLTPFQLLALLGQQLRLQRPIGRYFVDRCLVTEDELDEARARIFRHNLRHSAP